MSTGARIFFVGSILFSGITVLTVNYYIDEEKQRKRSNIIAEMSQREEKHRFNMEEYQRQLKIEEKLLEKEKHDDF